MPDLQPVDRGKRDSEPLSHAHLGRPKLAEDAPAQPLAPDREPSPLILVEAESPASLEFLKNANLFLQKLNLLPLLVVQPPSDGQK